MIIEKADKDFHVVITHHSVEAEAIGRDVFIEHSGLEHFLFQKTFTKIKKF